ncbi:MAG: PEP-CTERM system TPR-repeat protein PrsT [Betaproteobacteria bacterium]|nr:PEP-CTERM system TPR-repeat protein PrsT [Betaproteobacteria bacterium]
MRSHFPRIAPLVLSLALAFSSAASLSGCDRSAHLSVEEHIERAKDFQSKGDTRASILELKNAVQKDPNNAQARWLLGNAYLDLRLGGEAETQLDKAVKLGINPKSARIPIARAQLYQGNFQQILDTLPAVDTEEPGVLVQILDLRGNALLGLGKYPEGCQLFDRAIQSDKSFAPSYLGRARCEYSAGRTDAAVASAKQATTLDPRRLESWYLLGDLYRAIQQPDDALAAYDHALTIKAQDFDAIAYKAMTLLSVNRVKEAETEIKRLNSLRPQALLAKYLKAYLYYQEKKNNEAVNLLQEVLKDNPDNPQANLLYGTINYALKNDEIALSSFNRVLSTTELPEARLLLAATQLRMGANADVIKTLEPLLAQRNNAKAYLLAGQATLNLGETDRGMAYLNQASTLDPKDTVIRSTLAQNQLLSGDQQGIKGLESVITANPDDSQAYLLLATSQVGKADFKGALATLQKMAAAQPSNALPSVLMGRIYLMQRNPDAARKAFEHSLTLDAGFLPAASALASLDIEEKKPAQAKERFKTILSKSPDNLGALMGQARIGLVVGDKKEFVTYLEKAIQSHPDALEPVSLLTQYYMSQMRQPELALEVAQKAAKANNGNPAFLDNLGQAQLGAGHKKDAIDTYTNVTNRAPNSAIAWYHLAWAQRVAGDMNAALKSLQKSVRLAPNYLDARIALAGLYAVLGQQDNALQETRTIQTLNPQSATGYNLEAELAARFKKPDASLQALARAHQTAPSSSTAATYHFALIRAGKTAQAEQVAQQWLNQHPDDSVFRMYLAGTYLQKRQTGQAVDEYRQIVKTNPNHVMALNNLAAVLEEQNDPNAFGYAQRAYGLQPANPVVMDTYGWSLLQQGKIQEATPLLKQAAQAMPETPSVQYHWAAALVKSGQTSEARALLQKLLASSQRFDERDKASALLKTVEIPSKR